MNNLLLGLMELGEFKFTLRISKKTFLIHKLTLTLPILLFLFSCEETTVKNIDNGKLYSIEGFAQKGPFVVGTDVTVAELNDKLVPTGRIFFATVLDDNGRFKLPGVVLESPYIQIKITGFYLSEVWGDVYEDELTLFSLADVRKSEKINVNIITHLESKRVEYLVQKENLSFEEAKAKAFKEFLSVFNWNNFDVISSELLDISKNDEGGAILLATACIFEQIQDDYVNRLAKITSFRTDFTDGKIDSTRTQNLLLTAASLLYEEQILFNLKRHYGDKEFSDFMPLINEFKQKSLYTNYTTFANLIPSTVDNKINLLKLSGENVLLDPNKSYYIFVNPSGSLPNAKLEFSVNINNLDKFNLKPDPDVNLYTHSLFTGYYSYSNNNKNWPQKSIEVNFISSGGYWDGSCSYYLYVDGLYISGNDVSFKY